jgi:uncharacterized protein YceK
MNKRVQEVAIMKNKFGFVSLFLILLVIVLLVAGCGTTSTVTRVITVSTPVNTAGATITRTITQTIGGETQTTVVVLDKNPPPMPHQFGIDFMGCFVCHPIPPGHEGRTLNEDVCFECHVGP